MLAEWDDDAWREWERDDALSSGELIFGGVDATYAKGSDHRVSF
jgi:hypothetical protein